MTARRLQSALAQLRKLLNPQQTDLLPDQQLLRRFLHQHEEAAFAALMERHGPMVLGVCRSVLRHAQDAEDVFQATFLVLARKAGSIRKQASLANWLHGVAYRLARKQQAGRGRVVDQRPSTVPSSNLLDELSGREVCQIVHEELDRLPANWRLPLLLCYLEGQTQEEAARQLGWSAGALRGRLDRGRERLRVRLTQRGLAMSAPLLATALAPAALSAGLIDTTVRAALPFQLGQTVAGAVSAKVIALAEGGLQAMWMSQVKVGALVLALGLLLGGAGLAGYQAGSSETPAVAEKPQVKQPEAKAEGPKKRVDKFGDPLPEGVLARLGTTRFRHDGEASMLVYSSDGKYLVGRSLSGVSVWEAATGKERYRLPILDLKASNQAIHQQQLDLSPDGMTLAALEFAPSTLKGGNPKVRPMSVGFWNLSSGKKLHTFKRPDTGLWLRFSPDGKSLLLQEGQKKLVLVDPTTGAVQSKLEFGGLRRIHSCAFSRDGKTIALGVVGVADDHSLQLWDIAAGKVVQIIRDPNPQKTGLADISAVAFSPDGKTVAWTARGQIYLTDSATGKQTDQFAIDRGPSIVGLAFTADGKTLLAADSLGKIRGWDVASAEVRFTLESEPRDRGYSLALAPDAKTVALGTSAAAVRVWNMATGKEQFTDFQAHDNAVASLAFSPDGKTLFSACKSPPVRVWDVGAWTQQPALPKTFQGEHLVMSPDGNHIAGFSRNVLQLWDVAARKPQFKESVQKEKIASNRFMAAAFSADGRKLLALEGDSFSGNSFFIRQWDTASGTQDFQRALDDRLKPGSSGIKPAFLALDRRAVLFRKQTEYYLQDFVSGREYSWALNAAEKSSGPPFATAFAPDGSLVVTTNQLRGPDGFFHGAVLSETRTGQQISVLKGHHLPIQALAWSRDVQLVATGDSSYNKVTAKSDQTSALSTIRLWHALTGQELTQLGNFGTEVTALAFSPDGSTLAAGMKDSTILIYDISKFRPAPENKQFTKQELDSLWTDLGDENAAKAYKAAGALTTGPAATVAFLKERLKPIPNVDAKKIEKWIADLSSDQAPVRIAAVQELQNVLPQAESAMRKAQSEVKAPEAKRHLERLLSKVDASSKETLQSLRAIMVLERIATPEARAVLESLAAGASGARETEDARAALQRLGKR